MTTHRPTVARGAAFLPLLLTGCFFGDVAVGWPSGEGGEESSSSGEPAQGVTGDTADSGETDSATGEGSGGGSGVGVESSGSGSTGGAVDHCPNGVPEMMGDVCKCILDDGSARPVDPVACGCGEPDECTCDGVQYPAWSCAWGCQDLLDGQGCQCEGIAAPSGLCSYACDSAPAFVNGACVCSGLAGVTEIDAQWCACGVSLGTGDCMCGPATVPGWFC